MLTTRRSQQGLPSFHLYGEPPDDQAFDFIHIETLPSRSTRYGWIIDAHRHRNLFQILLIERGGGEMMHDATMLSLRAPAAILVPPNVAHAYRFVPELTDGWIVSFTEDAVQPFGERSAFALTQLKALAIRPMVPLQNDAGAKRLFALCDDLYREGLSAGLGYHHAMRGLLALITIEVIRLAGAESEQQMRGCASSNATVRALERLIDEHFHLGRHVAFYAEKLAMKPDRLNDHVKRSAGTTAGRLIRQRVLAEAKRRLVFTNEPIHRIASNLAFSDLSHFIRFFRQNTGTTPHIFREQRDT
jgi:AraC family transcriptional regulator, transcriptional activator of pobA